MSRRRVAVIGGGTSAEHEVSLASAAAAVDALDPELFDAVPVTIGRDGGWSLAGRTVPFADAVAALGGCDLVLPLVHGAPGEDGALAALCELAGLPYAGSGVGAGAIAMDKHLTKLLAAALGIRTARGVLLTRADRDGFRWTEPVIVKPVGAGSSRGVALVAGPHELGAALDGAFGFDDRVLVEERLIGREIDIAVLGGVEPLVSAPLEIHTPGLFDYDAKYGDGATRFAVPAPLTVVEAAGLRRAALALYRALGCRGVARLDFFLTADGWVLNEVNTVPGMTEHSQVPRMFAAVGLPYRALLTRLIASAPTPQETS